MKILITAQFFLTLNKKSSALPRPFACGTLNIVTFNLPINPLLKNIKYFSPTIGPGCYDRTGRPRESKVKLLLRLARWRLGEKVKVQRVHSCVPRVR
jgi:hypothetical protein